MRRRDWLLGASGLSASALLGSPAWAATPESDDLEAHDIQLDGEPSLARRALVLRPTHPPARTSRRVLVLLHGLGETGNELLGIHAWGDRYGLVRSHERLRRPPLGRTLKRERYLEDARLKVLNAALEKRAYVGMTYACPVTPNPYKGGNQQAVLDRYAGWLEEVLLPRLHEELGGELTVGLDGCSLGGFVGIEVLLRKPHLFRSFGMVQSAFGAGVAPHYARRLAEVIDASGPVPIHLETSTGDPYRSANETLSRHLHELGVPHQLRVIPGPHNQPWLREVGTLEMLLFHDRQLLG